MVCPPISQFEKLETVRLGERIHFRAGILTMSAGIENNHPNIAAKVVVEPETGNAVTDWRQSKWLVLVEFAIVVLVFVADFKHLIPFSKTPVLLVFGWVSVRLRKLRWR